jgi:hypothetical protein
MLFVLHPAALAGGDLPCPQAASFILKELGLPAIGQELPLRGTRLDLDRRGEARNPPVLEDGRTGDGNPVHEILVRMGPVPGDAKRWQVRLTRIFDASQVEPGKARRLSMSSVLTYLPDARENRRVCILERVEARMQVGEKIEARSISKKDCKFLLDPDSNADEKKFGPRLLRYWLRRDCLLDPDLSRAVENL